MSQFVSITSQGQITLPASMRRLIALDLYKKALVRIEKQRIIIEPVADFLSLGGTLKHKAKKNQNIDKIIQSEENVIAKMIK